MTSHNNNNNNHDLEKGFTSSEQLKTSLSGTDSSTSSSDSSSNSGSPPSTPPSDESSSPERERDALPRLQHTPHSSTLPRRGGRRPRNSPSSRLGAIDEHSSSVAPDIPTRNPARKLVGFKLNNGANFWSFAGWGDKEKDKYGDVPAPGTYDRVLGPKGEKLGDVRRNRRGGEPVHGKRRRNMCIGIIVLVVALVIALGVGLGVGLTRKKDSSTNVDVSPNGVVEGNDDDPKPFPIGTWSIPTYLRTADTSCTSNPSTWRCYPYTTYSQSSSNSYNTLVWRIASPTNSTLDLEISNTDPTFSYPFTNVPLTLFDANDVTQSSFSFQYRWRKQVVPSADITGDGSATRCYFNDTLLSVKLYNNVQGATGNGSVVGPPLGVNAVGQEWPWAIAYQETFSSGPECFRYRDGVEGEKVDVPAAATGDQCVCGYQNFGL